MNYETSTWITMRWCLLKMFCPPPILSGPLCVFLKKNLPYTLIQTLYVYSFRGKILPCTFIWACTFIRVIRVDFEYFTSNLKLDVIWTTTTIKPSHGIFQRCHLHFSARTFGVRLVSVVFSHRLQVEIHELVKNTSNTLQLQLHLLHFSKLKLNSFEWIPLGMLFL